MILSGGRKRTSSGMHSSTRGSSGSGSAVSSWIASLTSPCLKASILLRVAAEGNDPYLTVLHRSHALPHCTWTRRRVIVNLADPNNVSWIGLAVVTRTTYCETQRPHLRMEECGVMYRAVPDVGNVIVLQRSTIITTTIQSHMLSLKRSGTLSDREQE